MGKAHELSTHAPKEQAKPKPQTASPQETPVFLSEEELVAATGVSSPEDRLSNSLQRMPSEQLARQNLAAAQKLTGNALAARAVQRLSVDAALIQRHPPGAPLLGGTATAPGGGGGGGGPAPAPAGANVEGGGAEGPSAIGGAGPGAGAAPPAGPEAAPAGPGAAPAGPGAAPAGPGAAPAGPGAAPAGPGAAPAGPGAAPAGPGAAPAAPAGPAAAPPTTLGMPQLQTAYAQNAIQSAFGAAAGRTLITGNITVVPDQTTLYHEYDRICIEAGVINRRTGVLWVYGDLAGDNAAATPPLRTNAFAWHGSIWIDATQTDPTATVHEMLHVNTAPNFLENVGRTINEGITQRLAVQAVQATGQSVAGSESTYIQEQRVVNALINVIGEDNLVNAYFNDPNILVNTYNAVMGADTFPALKATLSADNQAGYDAAVTLLQPVSYATKLATLRVLLSPLWLLNDVERAVRIISTLGEFEKAMAEIELSDLIENLGILDRVRVRAALGVYERGEPAGEEVPEVNLPEGTALA